MQNDFLEGGTLVRSSFIKLSLSIAIVTNAVIFNDNNTSLSRLGRLSYH